MALTIVVIVVLVVVVAALAFALWQYQQRKRTQKLQQTFGPEYDRTVGTYGKKAESELARRQQKVEQYQIVPLSAGDRDRFTNQWRDVQAEFVDHPANAVESADRLIREAMTTRGYPAGSFGQREEAASVQYPDIVQNYRQAHAIVRRQEDGEATTEDLRQAMVLFRSLFERVVEPEKQPAGVS